MIKGFLLKSLPHRSKCFLVIYTICLSETFVTSWAFNLSIKSSTLCSTVKTFCILPVFFPKVDQQAPELHFLAKPFISSMIAFFHLGSLIASFHRCGKKQNSRRTRKLYWKETMIIKNKVGDIVFGARYDSFS